MLRESNRRFALLAVPTVTAALVASVLTTGAVSASTPTLSTVRINAGGPALTDVKGIHWHADSHYTGGKVGATNAETSGTPKQYLFRDERYGMSAYRIPVVNGRYDVKLLEAEQYYNAAGKRIFNVYAEGKLVARNVDIYARAGGKNRAYWLSFPTTVNDGRLDLEFTASVGSAKVNGIAITPSATQPVAPAPSPTATAAPQPVPDPTPQPEPVTESSPSPSPSATATTSPAPRSVLWGMDDDAEFDAAEAEFGRTFALARQYRRLDQSFVSSRGQTLVKGGRSLVVSVRARTSSAYIPYADITAGKHDATFLTGLRQLNALATPAYFIFQHEADSSAAKASCANQTEAGCGAEFVAAWRHIHDLAKANGLNKVVFTWTVTSYGFNPQTKIRNNHYWPGAAYTDWVGVDAYNGGCQDHWWGSFAQMLEYTLQWTQVNAPGKPIMLPEWGATEGSTASAKAEFFDGVLPTMNAPKYANVRAILYWNHGESGCDFRYTTSAASRAAFKELALQPLMSQMP